MLWRRIIYTTKYTESRWINFVLFCRSKLYLFGHSGLSIGRNNDSLQNDISSNSRNVLQTFLMIWYDMPPPEWSCRCVLQHSPSWLAPLYRWPKGTCTCKFHFIIAKRGTVLNLVQCACYNFFLYVPWLHYQYLNNIHTKEYRSYYIVLT